MRHQIASFVDNAITFLLLGIAGITPLFFLNQTTEFYEMPKLALLVVVTVILLGLWIFSWILKGKIVITRTPLDIPLIILMAVIIASAYFSESRFAAIYGNFPRVHGSAAAWITYILLYFVTVSNLNTLARVKTFLYVLYGSAVVTSFVTLLAFFNIYLPLDFARGANFTPTGSTFSTIAFLLLLLPFPLLSIINPNKYMPAPFATALSVLFGITIALTGSLSVYVALAIVVALTIVVSKPHQVRRTLPMLAIPLVVTAITLALAYLPFPGNILQQREANFPKEIQLPFPISWKVSVSSFRDAPFTGTGPSTYLYNFTSYKPVEFNQLRFWNFSFDTAHNEFLQVLGTIGAFGVIAFLLVILAIVNNSRKNLAVTYHEEHDDVTRILAPALAISALISIVLLALHATTLVSIVITFFMLAALMASQRSIRERVMELSLGIKASTADNKQFDLLPVIIFIIFIIGAVPLLYRVFNVVLADYYHRLALTQANRNGTLTYQYLQRAEALNPQVDLYRIDMAQTNFALANAIATNAIRNAGDKPAAEALSDRDRQTIQTLLTQSINEGRAAVALNPRSTRNWATLAAIYRNITGVSQNALAFSLDAYGRAIQRDPLNPALRINVGGIYYAAQNYDLAIRFFTDAANLKPDYANAYYNLAIALRDKGDLQNARLVAEQAVALLKDNTNSPDYKTATELLADIQKKAPAGEANSALNQNLPNVNVDELNDAPEDVATPSAVQANPNARVPQATPTPAR